MKSLYLLVFLFFSTRLLAQSTADFENFNLPIGSFDNNANDTGFFFSGDISIPNDYVDDPNFSYWNGWAISSMTDVTTPGFANEYSCIAGSGVNGSGTYALGYVFGSANMYLSGSTQGKIVQSLYLNNSTFAYLSMLNGDAFAKKFGGASGNDPDFFKLTIRKTLNGQVGADSVEFYLADYRFANNDQDYIIKDWTYLDLSPLGEADFIEFYLSSSDVGAFGMNTPAYFCMDNVTTTSLTPVAQQLDSKLDFKVWPNPTAHTLLLKWDEVIPATATISTAYGQVIKQFEIVPGQNSFNVSDLPSGVFTLQVSFEGQVASQKFIKQ
ncbi:MAG: DUF4465 domain-containing protein [Saprospiraceae bacterium]|nr:DUF4465 domain-containing protein [Saprospiraceae bacterium]